MRVRTGLLDPILAFNDDHKEKGAVRSGSSFDRSEFSALDSSVKRDAQTKRLLAHRPSVRLTSSRFWRRGFSSE